MYCAVNTFYIDEVVLPRTMY